MNASFLQIWGDAVCMCKLHCYQANVQFPYTGRETGYPSLRSYGTVPVVLLPPLPTPLHHHFRDHHLQNRLYDIYTYLYLEACTGRGFFKLKKCIPQCQSSFCLTEVRSAELELWWVQFLTRMGSLGSCCRQHKNQVLIYAHKSLTYLCPKCHLHAQSSKNIDCSGSKEGRFWGVGGQQQHWDQYPCLNDPHTGLIDRCSFCCCLVPQSWRSLKQNKT